MKKDVAKQHIALRDQLRKQFQDERISDVDFLYETAKLFKPITESTEKVLQKLPTTVQPTTALTLPHVLALPPPPPPPSSPVASSSSKKDYALINPDSDLDVELLEEMGFPRPSSIKDTDKYEDIIQQVNNYNKYVLGREKRGPVTSGKKDELSDKIQLNRDYVKRLRLLASGRDLIVKGQGLKMIGNNFGSLVINRDKLASGMLHVSRKDGTVVMDEQSDRSLYDLLTKKFSKSHKYSKNAIETFKKLAALAGISVYRGRSSKSRMLGGGIFYNDPNDLVNRLNLLVASKHAGNTGVDNEISDIIDELLKKAYVSKDVAIQLYNKILY
jgi:hypothetical protein